MSKGISVNVNGVQQEAKASYVKLNGEWVKFGSAQKAAFNEAASSGATFTTLTNPDGDGKNYRLAKFTGNGTLAFSQPGTVRFLVVGGGGGGGSYMCAGPGAGGWVLDEYQKVTASSYSVVVGAGGAAEAGIGGCGVHGGASTVKGENVSLNTGFAGGGGSYNWGDGSNMPGQQGVNIGGGGVVQSVSIGNNGLGHGPGTHGGGGGSGGPASGNYGGPGKPSDITGSIVKYGAGGSRGTNGGSGTPGVDGGGAGGNGNGGPVKLAGNGTDGLGAGGGSKGWDSNQRSGRGGSGIIYARVEI